MIGFVKRWLGAACNKGMAIHNSGKQDERALLGNGRGRQESFEQDRKSCLFEMMIRGKDFDQCSLVHHHE